VKKKYVVELTTEERSQLQTIVRAERIAAHKRRHAQMLLKVDQGVEGPGWSDAAVAEAFDCTLRSVERLRIRLVERGFEAGLEHGNRGKNRARKLDGVAEARLIALACGEAPAGRNRWTVRLLADQIVALEIVESCSKSAVHRVLKKTNLSLT
jgi:transposase